mgnify:CR=1 FL=1
MVWVRSKKKYMRTGTAAASHRTSGAGKPESPAERPFEPRVPVWLIVGPALFLAGIAAGAVFSGNAPREAVSHLDFLFQTDFRLRLEDPFFFVFVSSLAGHSDWFGGDFLSSPGKLEIFQTAFHRMFG